MLESGELYIYGLEKSDQHSSFRCRTRHRLSSVDQMSSNAASVTVAGCLQFLSLSLSLSIFLFLHLQRLNGWFHFLKTSLEPIFQYWIAAVCIYVLFLPPTPPPPPLPPPSNWIIFDVCCLGFDDSSAELVSIGLCGVEIVAICTIESIDRFHSFINN